MLAALDAPPFLVNIGGDLRVSGQRCGALPWWVAMESVDEVGTAAAFMEIAGGGITTSGDARRSIVANGRRYSHILDLRTGWAVLDPPTCLEAAILSTLSMLHGRRAEAFLRREKIQGLWIR